MFSLIISLEEVCIFYVYIDTGTAEFASFNDSNLDSTYTSPKETRIQLGLSNSNGY